MTIARDKVAAARALFAQGFYNDTLSKAYYAMFYASKGILWMLGEDPHRHKGVIAFFGQKIVRVGLADSRYGRLLADYERLREQADYKTAFRATQKQAKNAIRDAEDFVNEAQETLKKIQARGKNHVH
ncbi:MAG: HEPN domain-containing protein [Chloroflexota bacterium]